MSTNTSGLSRRTIVKGAAWSVPVVAVAGAAPAFAASPIPPRGLNGWVTLSRSCGRTEFSIDGRGLFTGGGTSDRGIWTFVDDPNADITHAQIIFWFDRDGWTFTNGNGSDWSNLTRMNPQPSPPAQGYVAYVTTYTGGWTYFPQHEAWVADTDPYWYTRDMPGRCTRRVRAYADRSITVNGETVAFRRGPVSV